MNIYMFNTETVGLFIDNLLYIMYFIIIFSGICIIMNKNPVLSVLYLILLFSIIGFSLIALNISFIGLSYLLVYVGAVSILFLFILMLINVRISELVTNNSNSVPLSLFIISIFSISLNISSIGQRSSYYSGIIPNLKDISDTLTLWKTESTNSNYATNEYNDTIYRIVGDNWDTVITDSSQISSVGNIIYTTYPMLLFVISIILLLAMIGSIVITVKK